MGVICMSCVMSWLSCVLYIMCDMWQCACVVSGDGRGRLPVSNRPEWPHHRPEWPHHGDVRTRGHAEHWGATNDPQSTRDTGPGPTQPPWQGSHLREWLKHCPGEIINNSEFWEYKVRCTRAEWPRAPAPGMMKRTPSRCEDNIEPSSFFLVNLCVRKRGGKIAHLLEKWVITDDMEKLSAAQFLIGLEHKLCNLIGWKNGAADLLAIMHF